MIRDNKDGNKSGLRNGLFTEARPTHEWGDESNKVLGWRDADGNKPEKKKKTKKDSTGETEGVEKKPRKCSCCGQTGHTKATCPKLKEDLTETDEVKALKEQLAAAQAKIAQHESASDEEKTQACEVGLDVANLDDVKDVKEPTSTCMCKGPIVYFVKEPISKCMCKVPVVYFVKSPKAEVHVQRYMRSMPGYTHC